VHLFTPEPQPLPVAGPQLGEAVSRVLGEKGIGFHPLHKLTAVDPESHQLFFEGKAPFQYDLLVAIPPHRGPVLVREPGLANEAGWIPVDRATLSTKHPNATMPAIASTGAMLLSGHHKHRLEVGLSLPNSIL